MAGKRIKNGRLYYRKTVTKNGERYWLEQKEPFPDEVLPDICVEAVFNRFPEPHTAFLPLYLIHNYPIEPKAAYELKIGSYRHDKAVQRQVDRIFRCGVIFGYTTDYLIVDLKTGRPISSYQLAYISRVIRKEIEPDFKWRKFAKIARH